MMTLSYAKPIEIQTLVREKPQTAAEAKRVIWKMLRDGRCGGLQFQRQVTIEGYQLNYYCADLKLAIDVNGSIYTDPQSGHDDPMRPLLLQQELGITLLRFTVEDVVQSPLETLQTILLTAITLQSKREA